MKTHYSVRSAICNQIKKSRNGLLSVLIDESKDTARREELAITVRYNVGKVVERFYFDEGSIIDLITESSGAAIISLGADGASVMSGKYFGVAELLRSEQFQCLVYTHCTLHRLNIVANDIIKGSPLALDIMTMVNSLYSFFNIPKSDHCTRPCIKNCTQEARSNICITKWKFAGGASLRQ